jgi:hypothetical protein
MAMVHDGTDVIDKEYKKLCAEEWAKGGSFFCYLSDNPSSLASCCFSEDTKFLWKSSTNGVNISTFKEFEQMPYKNTKENFKIFHNGSWIEGKIISLENRPMYKVTTYNNKEFIMSDNHINITLKGEKETSQLSVDDYLLFNTNELQAVPENDEHLTFAQGFVIGAFLGDGSFGSEINGTIYETIISQNDNKGYYCIKQFEKALKHLGLDSNVNVGKVHNNVLPIKICSKKLVAFIQKWTHWKRGTYSFNKRLNLDCLLQSIDFRKGILAGWYNTDGGNSNRCYTTSSKLAEDMEALITSLGMQSIINISDRTNEKVIIRNEEYNKNYPLYCVRWYEKANHRNNKDKECSWIKKNNSIYFKIKSIEPYQYDHKIYCIQCKNINEPYFTLPSGLITHNCRVLNEIQDNTFNSINGLQGIMTGSCNVITLNINRIVQDWFHQKGGDENPREYNSLKEYISNILERVYKYHIAYKTMLYEWEDKGAYASSNAGYIYLNKLYSTIGAIGYCEAAQFLGLEISNNKEYKEFLQLIFGTIKEQNKLHNIKDNKRPFLFNFEAIPGENLAVKLYEWDKQDGYIIPKDQNLYSSYFFKQWDPNISILDKLKLHGKDVALYCDGGQAAHIHLNEHLSKEQYNKIIDFCIEEGVTYFTFNIPMSECKECGHVVNAPIVRCPKCNSNNIDYWVRIIGYLRPLSAFSKQRQIEASNRIYN